MKYLILIFTLANIAFKVSAQDSLTRTCNKGMVGSDAFIKYINSYEDPEMILKKDSEFFTLLGEGEFLYDNSLDFYAVYIYEDEYDTAMSVYSILSRKGIGMATKRIIPNAHDCSGSDIAGLKSICTSEVSTRLLTDDDLAKYKSLATDLVNSSHERVSPEYHTPYQGLFLYDGEDYSMYTKFNTSEALLKRLDESFRKPGVF